MFSGALTWAYGYLIPSVYLQRLDTIVAVSVSQLFKDNVAAFVPWWEVGREARGGKLVVLMELGK